MLSVGQHFKSFHQLFRVVQHHEQQSNGAFELTKEKLPNGGGKVSCKCSGPLDGGSGSCPAFVVAEERSLNNVIITAAFLQHNHPWSGPIAGVNNRVPEDSYKKVTVAPPLTPPPVLQPAEPFDMQDDNVEPSTPTTPTNFFQELKRVPRRYLTSDGILNLINNSVYQLDCKYYCPFCEKISFPSLNLIETHLKTVHEAAAIESNGGYYVPCYAHCQQDCRRKVSSAHYHCRCGVLFHSAKAIVNHTRFGVCESSQQISGGVSTSDRPQRKAKLEAMELVEKVSKGKVIEFGTLTAKKCRLSGRKVTEIDLSSVKPNELAHLLSSGKTVNEALLEIFEKMQNSEQTVAADTVIQSSTVDIDPFEIEAGEIIDDSPDWAPKTRMKKLNKNGAKMEKCRWCVMEFVSLKELLEHMQSEHPQTRFVLPVNLLCTLCGKKLDMVEDLAMHYRDDHQLKDCDVEYTSFNSAMDFYTWKSHMEVDSYSYFVKRRRNLTDSEVTLFFACFYSWGDNRASLKEKKTERHCPAFIKASQRRESSVTNVAYCLYHVGHELPKDRFWKQIQKSLHGLLSFRHKAKSETRRFETELALKMCHSSSSNANVTPWGDSDGQIPEPFDLDDAMSFYWETMRDKLTESGNYSLSIDGRWSNRLPADPEDRLCRICQVEFKNHKSMMRHMLRIHDPKRRSPQSKYSRPVRCLFCNMEMAPPGMKNLIQHYINAHDQQIQLKMRLFRHIDEFNLWREAVTGNVFKRHKFYQSAKGENRQYWTCKFSGKLQNPPAGVTEGHCPAWIFAQTTSDSNVQVSYCLYHIGHELNPDGNATDVPKSVSRRLQLQQADSEAPLLQPSVLSNLGQPSSSLDNESKTFALLLGNDIIQLTEGIAFQIVEPSQQLPSAALLSNIEPLRIVSPQPELSMLASDVTDTDVAAVETIDQPIGGRQGGVSLIVDSIGAPCTSSDLANDASQSTEETILRHQITVLVRSTTGVIKFVKVALSDFPLVTKDGRKYYALDESSLVEAVSQVLVRQGEVLYEGDQLEILQ